jgi:C-terminal processing protease CtpA/Prc
VCRTGALRVGDEILAINGHDLAGKTLADAIELLQSKQSVVSLKIARRGWSSE